LLESIIHIIFFSLEGQNDEEKKSDWAANPAHFFSASLEPLYRPLLAIQAILEYPPANDDERRPLLVKGLFEGLTIFFLIIFKFPHCFCIKNCI
jgi:hypothetical protein